jgi:predicted ArsR family transcriptional regulator
MMTEMKSTKDRILQTLLENPKSTIQDLADSVGINAISVRHHLTNLLASGVVLSEEERHGVGRPRLVYSLTEEGLEQFPTRYYRFANRLLDYIKGTIPYKQVTKIFDDMAQGLTVGVRPKTNSMMMDQRLNFLMEILSKEGFGVEWERSGDQYLIHERTCPYFQIGQKHPEVCMFDQTIISNILNIPVEKIECVLSGDAMCTYIVPAQPTEVN